MKFFYKKLTVALVALLLLVAGFSRASAHAGGEARLVSAEAGPFLISLWTLPNPMVAGEANFIAAVGQPTAETGDTGGVVVLDADLQLTLTPPSGPAFSLPVTHETATNKLFYESYMTLDEVGTWQASLQISRGAEQGTAAFEFTVAPAPFNANWMLIGGIAIVVLALGWMALQTRRQKT